MEAKRNGEYWRRAYECPFYQTNKIGHVVCEAATIHFTTKPGIRSFLDTCEMGYRSCPIYNALMKDYEERERIEREQNIQFRARNYRTQRKV